MRQSLGYRSIRLQATGTECRDRGTTGTVHGTADRRPSKRWGPAAYFPSTSILSSASVSSFASASWSVMSGCSGVTDT
jgi:hypothetical protein